MALTILLIAGDDAGARSLALPRFQDYPAAPSGGRAAAVVLRRDDVMYRTRLRYAAGQPANFAGEYALALWGCGAECVMGAAVSRRTGRVTWLPGTVCCWGFGVPADFEPVRFQLRSSLVVLTGRRNEREGDDGTHYYRLTGGRFVPIRSVRGPSSVR